MSTTLPSRYARDLIAADLRRQRQQRLYEFSALLLTMLAPVCAWLLALGLRRDAAAGGEYFYVAALCLAVSLLAGLWLVFSTRGRKFASWLALLALGLPVAAAWQTWGLGTATAPALAGLRCYIAILITSLLATMAVMFWMVQHIPPQQSGKFRYFLFLGSVLSLIGTLMVYLRCPVTSGSHLAWHVAAAWSGALVFGWLAMRFHRAWWLIKVRQDGKT